MLRHEIMAAEYRSRAQAETDRADGSSLQRVREQHETAAAAWSALADTEERRIASLALKFGRAAEAAATS